MDIFKAKTVHCIGIGGIGVSALARLWHAQGKTVNGSDAVESEITRALEAQGIKVIYGGPSSGCSEDGPPDIIIYSDAVPEDHPQRVEARRHGIPEFSYAQALGMISHKYKTIVVTGTHGKSTTTALLGLMLEAGGMDPLVIVGTQVTEWENSNVRIPSIMYHPERREGSRDSSATPPNDKVGWLIVEGDDYRDHFLELQPHAVVVTNIEYDHPDYFKDLEQTIESFKKLCEKVSDDGFVVLSEDDPACQKLHSTIRANRRMINYGRNREVFSKLQLQIPGEFNRYNATAAATAAIALGVSSAVVEKVVREFKGVWRRFEVVGKLPPPLTPPRAGGEISSLAGGEVRRGAITIISDYAHHPTAIRETMKAAREFYPERRIVLVYQPHQHSRTKRLFNDFAAALTDAADVVIVSEIYAVKGRMEEQDIDSQKLVNEISNFQFSISKVLYGGNLEQTKSVVMKNAQAGDVIIFMGAGDIDALARELVVN